MKFAFLKNQTKHRYKRKIIPKIFEELTDTESSYQAEYSDIEDLKELLNLSNKNAQHSSSNTWEKVFAIISIIPQLTDNSFKHIIYRLLQMICHFT